MRASKIIPVEKAVDLIKDNDTIVVCGCENLLLAEKVLKAIEERFVKTGHPKNLAEMHPVTYGMGDGVGLEHFAHEGLLKRSMGSGFSYLKTSNMARMVRENKIEAYVMPMGTVYRIIQNVASGEAYTLTDVGLNTFVDPRIEGGCMNGATPNTLAEVIRFKDKELLCYQNPKIDIAIIRGTTADEDGNLSLEEEPLNLGIAAMAMAAKACRGKVIAQVKRVAKRGSIHPRSVIVPGIMVDAVVVDEEQYFSGGAKLNPALTGEIRMPMGQIPFLPLDIHKVITRRAADEIAAPPQTVNLGVGIPTGVPVILVEEDRLDGITFFPEHGSLGGVPGERSIFGTNINPDAIIDPTQVFQSFRGGGLDITFLGCGQIDLDGNVNVSKFNGIVPGCGGFIDITYKTKNVVFCGPFSTGGADIRVEDGKIRIYREGKYLKFVPRVEQITLNGQQALKKGQRVVYVTERGVFFLQEDGIHLKEIAPGIDAEKDILSHIPFEIIVDRDLKVMDKKYFE